MPLGVRPPLSEGGHGRVDTACNACCVHNHRHHPDCTSVSSQRPKSGPTQTIIVGSFCRTEERRKTTNKTKKTQNNNNNKQTTNNNKIIKTVLLPCKESNPLPLGLQTARFQRATRSREVLCGARWCTRSDGRTMAAWAAWVVPGRERS